MNAIVCCHNPIVDVYGRVNEVNNLTGFGVVHKRVKVNSVDKHNCHLAKRLAYCVWLHTAILIKTD